MAERGMRDCVRSRGFNTRNERGCVHLTRHGWDRGLTAKRNEGEWLMMMGDG